MKIPFLRAIKWPAFLWAAMAIYVVLAPAIHDRFLVSAATPVAVDPVLPDPTTMGYVSLDALSPSSREPGVYQIAGWGFPILEDGSSVADFERRLVLSSSQHTYVFQANSGLRKDVRDVFAGLQMDVYPSGFAASINKYSLPVGSYSVGLLFIPANGGASHWVISGRCLERTPNGVLEPDSKDSACQPPSGPSLGRPSSEDAVLPSPHSESEMGIDDISAFNDAAGLYRLEGWGFITSAGARPLGEYRRQLVLISDQRNLVFPALPIPRPDVQESFAASDQDLGLSGFVTYLDARSVPDDSYVIGLLLTDAAHSEQYLVVKDWCLRSTAGKLRFARPGAGACSPASNPSTP